MAQRVEGFKYKFSPTISYAGEPRPRITEAIKLKILMDVSKSLSVAKIARKYKVAPSSVSYIVNKFKTHGTVQNLHGGGRKHLLDAQTIAELKVRLNNSTLHSVSDCVNWVNKCRGVTVTPAIMLKTLTAHGMRNYVCQSKPLMSADGAAERYVWAREKAKLTDEEWSRVVFSDEKTFSQSPHQSIVKVLLPKKTPFDFRRMRPSLINGGVHVKLWAAISPDGFLSYVFYDGALTGEAYVKILEEHLLPAALEKFGSHDNWTFQQDNAPCHTVDDVYNLLEENGIDDEHHPPNSPDLNIVENVWATMVKRVSEKKPRNKAELTTAIEDVITELNAEEEQTHYFKHLYSSMRDRVREVLQNRGIPTLH